MSKSCNFQNEIISDGYVLRQNKDCDGRILSVGLSMDPDFNKEDFEIIEYLDCSMLQYNDRFSVYQLNYCGGRYFCNESDL